jgi:hypothetical protein
VTDDTDLDRLFTRLSTAGRRRPAPDDHPAPEKLSAYLADELSPEEDDALQEHLTACPLCTDLLLDLNRFLEPPEEDRPREGVADFETAAEWRELRGRMGSASSPPVGVRKRRDPHRIFGSPALAAVLALLFIGTASRMFVLERERGRPIAVQITTLEAQGSKKGAPGTAEPTTFRLGNVAVFQTHSERPYPKHRLSFRDKDGRIQTTLEAQEDENGMIALVLPRDFLPPGRYLVEVSGLEGTTANSIGEFDIQILQ